MARLRLSPRSSQWFGYVSNQAPPSKPEPNLQRVSLSLCLSVFDEEMRAVSEQQANSALSP